jgi:hypothetical protein
VSAGKPGDEPTPLARFLDIETDGIYARAQDISRSLDVIEEALAAVENIQALYPKVESAVEVIKERIADIRDCRRWIGVAANRIGDRAAEFKDGASTSQEGTVQ